MFISKISAFKIQDINLIFPDIFYIDNKNNNFL